MLLPSYCGMGDHGHQATRSQYLHQHGLVCFEIAYGQIVEMHPFVKTLEGSSVFTAQRRLETLVEQGVLETLKVWDPEQAHHIRVWRKVEHSCSNGGDPAEGSEPALRAGLGMN